MSLPTPAYSPASSNALREGPLKLPCPLCWDTELKDASFKPHYNKEWCKALQSCLSWSCPYTGLTFNTKAEIIDHLLSWTRNRLVSVLWDDFEVSTMPAWEWVTTYKNFAVALKMKSFESQVFLELPARPSVATAYLAPTPLIPSANITMTMIDPQQGMARPQHQDHDDYHGVPDLQPDHRSANVSAIPSSTALAPPCLQQYPAMRSDFAGPQAPELSAASNNDYFQNYRRPVPSDGTMSLSNPTDMALANAYNASSLVSAPQNFSMQHPGYAGVPATSTNPPQQLPVTTHWQSMEWAHNNYTA
jgi:hypothetical protein